MRTIYNKTSNIVDLAELRRRQALTQRDSLARQTREDFWPPEGASDFHPVVLTATREERRRARRERFAWGLEVCACLSMILMAAAFALRILI